MSSPLKRRRRGQLSGLRRWRRRLESPVYLESYLEDRGATGRAATGLLCDGVPLARPAHPGLTTMPLATRRAPTNRSGTPDQIDRFPGDLGVKASQQLFRPPFRAAASGDALAVLLGVYQVLYDRGMRPGGLRNRGSSCSSFLTREGQRRGLSPWWLQCCSLWSHRCSSPLGRRR